MNKENIKNTIEEIFKHTGCTINSCEFTDEGDVLWCSISTPDSRFLIGREGEALRSLNHLVRKMLEKNLSEQESQNLMIDINGYQKQRLDTLKATAHMLAERAKYFKSNIEVDPMPAYERRVIHTFLENVEDIITESTGVGPNRRIIIKYKGEI